MRTQEEEVEEDPTDNLLRRQKRDKLGPGKDSAPTPRSDGPKPRKEAEPVQPEPMEELLVRQETVVQVVQEPVIELPTSPG